MTFDISAIITLDASDEEAALNRFADLMFELIDKGNTDLSWISYGAREQS